VHEVVLFALLGLGSGALTAGLALALVATYRGSGIVNLATGAIAMLSGYAFWSLNTEAHVGSAASFASGRIDTSRAARVRSTSSACFRMISREQAPPTNPSIRPSAKMMARSPR